MIKTKKDLNNYIKADFIMNRGCYTFIKRILTFLSGDLIIKYLKQLRKTEYAINTKSPFAAFQKFKLRKLSYKTGFSISPNVLGYGVVIPHHGTIVVGGGNTIGNYCVLHTSTCITSGHKIIGDGFYLSSGAKVTKDIFVPNNVSVGANSLLNHSVDKPNSLYAGMPAKFIKSMDAWYIKDGEKRLDLVSKCESFFK